MFYVQYPWKKPSLVRQLVAFSSPPSFFSMPIFCSRVSGFPSPFFSPCGLPLPLFVTRSSSLPFFLPSTQLFFATSVPLFEPGGVEIPHPFFSSLLYPLTKPGISRIHKKPKITRGKGKNPQPGNLAFFKHPLNVTLFKNGGGGEDI